MSSTPLSSLLKHTEEPANLQCRIIMMCCCFIDTIVPVTTNVYGMVATVVGVYSACRYSTNSGMRKDVQSFKGGTHNKSDHCPLQVVQVQPQLLYTMSSASKMLVSTMQ
ncbi:hypothetical protein ACFE04_027831 [Oxalis oulophora]